MKPDSPYTDEEGISICQLNAKGYALVNFIDSMFDEETSLASFKAAGGTDEDWLRLLAELAEPEAKLDYNRIAEDALTPFEKSERLLQRIFPVAELTNEGN